MEISINGNKSFYGRMVTFNELPTILKVTETDTPTGTKYKIKFTVFAGKYTSTTQYYLSLNGHRISSVPSYTQLTSNTFLTESLSGYLYARTMAYHIVKALNTTPLAATYNIYMTNDAPISTTLNAVGACFVLEARFIGSNYAITDIQHNFPTNYLSYTVQNLGSTSESTLDGSTVILDLYAETDPSKQTSVDGMTYAEPENFIATMEKKHAYDGVSFNLSPLLSTITEDGQPTQYYVRAYYVNKQGRHNNIGQVTGLMALNGYQVNQGESYLLPTAQYYTLLQNVSKGNNTTQYINNTVLYYYPKQQITISVLTPDKSNVPYTVTYYNSAMEEIKANRYTASNTNNLYTLRYSPEDVTDAYNMTIKIGDSFTLHYKLISPVSYTNANTIQTIYFNNSYGGTSFFTFTGKRIEERETEKTIYTPHPLDIYDQTRISRDKIYKNNRTYTVTLTTHYIEKDAIYTLYDLNNSKSAWTIINGKQYEIIVEEISYNEVQRDLFECTVKYRYSAQDIV